MVDAGFMVKEVVSMLDWFEALERHGGLVLGKDGYVLRTQFDVKRHTN